MMHVFGRSVHIPCRNRVHTMNCQDQACHQLSHADMFYNESVPRMDTETHQYMLDSHHDDNAVVLHVDMQLCHASSVDVAIKYVMCSIHV